MTKEVRTTRQTEGQRGTPFPSLPDAGNLVNWKKKLSDRRGAAESETVLPLSWLLDIPFFPPASALPILGGSHIPSLSLTF